MNFYDNIVPQINFPDNTFYSNQDKKIDLYPCQYDFYNEHVNKVLLPYDRPNPTNINMLIDDKLLELKKVILNEIIFYYKLFYMGNYLSFI